jgi:hypothetical protein
MGGREASNPKAAAWAREMGERASAGTFADAARFGEVVVVATLGSATEEALRMAGAESFRGKLVLDTTNPLDFSAGMPPKLVGGLGDSLGEKVQRALPGAHVVKAFNTVGNPLMFRPELPGGPPDMFICGDDAEARKKAAAICRDFGWGVVDVGGIGSAHYLEAMCLVWVISGALGGNWTRAFKMLTK